MRYKNDCMAQIPNNTKLIALVYILEPGKFGHGIINGGGRQLIWASQNTNDRSKQHRYPNFA